MPISHFRQWRNAPFRPITVYPDVAILGFIHTTLPAIRKRRNQDETFLVLLICTYWEALVLAIPVFFGYKPL
jgi:hypothetical protein